MSGALSSNFSQIASIKSNLSKENAIGIQGHHNGEGGDIENCNFTCISQNARGLKTDKNKRTTFFNYLKENGDIYFAQETHSTPETENLWKEECGCEAFFSHGTSNSCGVMTFF